MEDQLDQLVDAGVNPRLWRNTVSDQPTVEEILETLLELKKAVYNRRWERLIDAALNGKDVSGWTLRQGEDQWLQARYNSSSPALDDEDGSGPGAKRQRVQAGHNSSGPPE